MRSQSRAERTASFQRASSELSEHCVAYDIFIYTHDRYKSWARKTNRNARSRRYGPKKNLGRCLTSFLQPRNIDSIAAFRREERRAWGSTLTIGGRGHCLTTRFRCAVFSGDFNNKSVACFFPSKFHPRFFTDARIT